MPKKPFIPVPPPAPLADPEVLNPEDLYGAYCDGSIDLICVMGPTASGKTRYAVALARELNRLCREKGKLNGAEIISGDSRQVYIGMDIGTGKDLKEYGEIPYHLIDIVPAGAKYNICQYQKDFSDVYADCLKRGVIPVLCGGSGLYIEAVTCAKYSLPDNVPLNLTLPRSTFFIATLVDRQTRRARIDKRLNERLDEGMLIEVKNLLESGLTPEDLIYYGLEYRFLTLYAMGQLTVNQMHEQLRFAIHKFAKRQMTWLRGMERDGIRIHWVEP
ncbi:MAG: tRNA (adenosine(37)-N6)-dimethylallyltransferase MiaA [Bacteroidales bacterium]|nr:tRNA (adenosine(37)-N6)-dimethylallyltransferase MiaA [Bacteroidales bacterium]